MEKISLVYKLQQIQIKWSNIWYLQNQNLSQKLKNKGKKSEDHTYIEQTSDMQNWEEFGLLNVTHITQEKASIENELEIDEEDNEVPE